MDKNYKISLICVDFDKYLWRKEQLGEKKNSHRFLEITFYLCSISNTQLHEPIHIICAYLRDSLYDHFQ